MLLFRLLLYKNMQENDLDAENDLVVESDLEVKNYLRVENDLEEKNHPMVNQGIIQNYISVLFMVTLSELFQIFFYGEYNSSFININVFVF